MLECGMTVCCVYDQGVQWRYYSTFNIPEYAIAARYVSLRSSCISVCAATDAHDSAAMALRNARARPLVRHL
eukprot:12326-Eustigmatos_ZCMA.PRE.1